MAPISVSRFGRPLGFSAGTIHIMAITISFLISIWLIYKNYFIHKYKTKKEIILIGRLISSIILVIFSYRIYDYISQNHSKSSF